ncbi:MAG TPA: serine/threonine-protein kinase [Stackebrandtia sp.]|uniref:serine/threonine-protein kinase n=1 Tax=Stackebrandtia sp. TaxID=2023065 RepID=UPI002D4FAB8A|nr:serine/threonine-protein kinase [Stackebrandtia sp.]HZE41297.1 serine/threonine-protein kinase [Stackebrandtia sp.]
MNDVLADRYEIESELARGAAGVVHRARDLVTGETVAIKVLHAESAADPAIATAFLDEAEVLAELDHPGIVRPRDLIIDGSLMALVMDLVDGVDLRRVLIDDGPLPPHRGVQVLSEIAAALAAVHAKGIIHGDVKPGNILLPADGGSVRLVDFGVARRTAAADAPTYATPDYTAPEIVAGNPSSAKSDVYGVGLVAYEVFCGVNPYRGGSIEEVLERQSESVPVRPEPLPAELWTVIESCLDADPAVRPEAQRIPEMLRAGAALLPEVAFARQTPRLRPRAAADAPALIEMAAPVPPAPPTSVAIAAGAPIPQAATGDKRKRAGVFVAAASILVAFAAGGALLFASLNGGDGQPDTKNQAKEESSQSKDSDSKGDKGKGQESSPSDGPSSTGEGGVGPTDDSTDDSGTGGNGGDGSGSGESSTDFPGEGQIGSPMPGNPGGR